MESSSNIFTRPREERQRDQLALHQKFLELVTEPARLSKDEIEKTKAASARFQEADAKHLGGALPSDIPVAISRLIFESQQLAEVGEATQALKEIPRITPEMLWGENENPKQIYFDSLTQSILMRLGHMRGRAGAIDRLTIRLEAVVAEIQDRMNWQAVELSQPKSFIEIIPRPKPTAPKIDSKFNPD